MTEKGEENMADKQKEFNYKLYGIIAVAVVSVALAALTFYAYTSRYIALDPEKMAVAYVDTIVQTGDGYNAYKDTLLSKDGKFGDFIRKYYIYPEMYIDNYTPDMDSKARKELKGYNNEELKNEADLKDDGTLKGKLIETMYPYFEALLEENNGFDNYDSIFSQYVAKVREIRAQVYGDTYFDDEVFFTAFEGNLSAYAESLTGCEDEFDKNTGVQLKEAKEGAYQKKYGEDYKIEVVSKGVKDTDIPDLSEYKTDAEAVEAKTVTVDVNVNGKPVVENLEITVVRIGHSWYVANKSCDTSALYDFYK